MDGSNGGNSHSGGDNGGNGDGSKRDLVYANRMRDRLESFNRSAQSMRELAMPYREEAFENMSRSIGDQDYSIPMRALGITRDKILTQGTGLVAALSAINGRSLEKPQVDAVASSLQESAVVTFMIKTGLGMSAVAATVPRWKKVPPWLRQRRMLAGFWPIMLITAYLIPVQLFIEPICLVINAKRSSNKLRNDPRLQGWKVDMREELERLSQQDGQGGEDGQYSFDGPSGQSNTLSKVPSSVWDTPTQPQQEQSNDSWSKQPTASWGSPSQPQKQEQTVNDAWDSDETYDDASPIAPSHRPAQADNSGSAWDRLRQQATTDQNQSQPVRQRQRPAARPSGEEWGTPQNTNSGYQGSRSDYSYSSADFEKSTAKDQAQRDFDQLLDRERQGVDQENKRWR